MKKVLKIEFTFVMTEECLKSDIIQEIVTDIRTGKTQREFMEDGKKKGLLKTTAIVVVNDYKPK